MQRLRRIRRTAALAVTAAVVCLGGTALAPASATNGGASTAPAALAEPTLPSPESEVNATGTPFTGTRPDGTVYGLIDAHSHMFMQDGMGGAAVCGKVFSEHGVETALRDCLSHEPHGLGALLENLTRDGSPIGTHDTTGWPTFTDWPAHDSLTHQQMYYRWVERAWRGGQRVLVNDLVTNGLLCSINPGTYQSCDEMTAIRRQAQDTYDLQDYVDAQYGGPGRGWFRIVTSSEQARQVIEEGKLAVVLGVETSEPFGCKQTLRIPHCSRAAIDRGLDELYDLGVRSMYLCHKFDNALCGVRFDGGTAGVVVNAANFYSTGRFWQAETCTGPAHDNTISVESDILAGPLAALLPPGVTLPVYPSAPHCNINGLTDLGRYAMAGMMDRGMLIDIDHMGVKAMDEALDVLEASDYPGVVSSHSWLDPSYYPRVLALGGIAGPYGHGTSQFVGEWRKVKDAAGPGADFGTGAGFDTGGFGHQPPPRADAVAHPLEYPFPTFDGGSTVDRQRTGERTYDLNVDGMAHYGLLPDWLADLRIAAGPDADAIMNDLTRGAETYLRTWERAEAH